MTDIEQKALSLVNEVRAERNQDLWRDVGDRKGYGMVLEALCRAIEQHEAFRQEVSDAVESIGASGVLLSRFILPKPDPLLDVAKELRAIYCVTGEAWSKSLRAAIEKRGGKIVWGEG